MQGMAEEGKFVFEPHEQHIDLCLQLCSLGGRLSVVPSILHDKNLNVEHYVQTFQSNSFISAIALGTIYLYHFIPPSVALTVVDGHKASFSRILFNS